MRLEKITPSVIVEANPHWKFSDYDLFTEHITVQDSIKDNILYQRIKID